MFCTFSCSLRNEAVGKPGLSASIDVTKRRFCASAPYREGVIGQLWSLFGYYSEESLTAFSDTVNPTIALDPNTSHIVQTISA
jgi:hypothetical protein